MKLQAHDEQHDTKWQDAFTRREPALIVGATGNFERVMKWTPSLIAARHASMPCKVARDGRPVLSEEMSTYAQFFQGTGQEKPLAESTYTFTRRTYDPNERAFIEDFDFPNPYFIEADIERHIVYAGPAKAGALPHAHGDALNFLVSGTKRWILFDASPDAPGQPLADHYWQTYGEGATWETWYAAEYEKLRAAKDVTLFEFEQHAGDLVYVPAKFAHTVVNLSPVLGIVIERRRTIESPNTR
ncbi:MAG TPA: hypothetical protein PK156_05390 [Polyangium sp.]|nr:hypothetical protein [Polyangium sp.]